MISQARNPPPTADSAASADTAAARIAWLDGLRGLAVLAVAAWHYTNRDYRSFFPYGDRYSAIPLLDHGWCGVNLFFLISGFVILMTLERCASLGEFLVRRWSRLFPAMLLASLLIFGVSQLLGDAMPHGRAPPVNLLPGLTFTIPTVWTALLDRPVDELDGVFWTLYVEVGFYLVFGLAFFAAGWRRGLMLLAGVWLATVAGSRLAAGFGLAWLATAVTPLQWLGAEYFGWFVAGALFRKAGECASDRLFAAAIGTGLVSALTSDLWQPGDALSQAYLAACVIGFALVLRSRRLRRGLAQRTLLAAGFASYPLYLLHNELGIGLIATLGPRLPPPAWPWLPALTLAVMFGMAWAVARWLEPPATGWLRTRLLGLADRKPAPPLG